MFDTYRTDQIYVLNLSHVSLVDFLSVEIIFV